MQPMATRYSLAVPGYRNEETIPDLLDAPSGIDRELGGVYLPPRTWGVQYDYSPDAALLVFASHAYDARITSG